MSIIKPGLTYELASGGSVTVVEKLKGVKVLVKHNDRFEHHVVVCLSNLYEGNIKNPYAPNVSGHGYFGVGPYVGVKGKVRYSSYRIWRTMLYRAYIKPGIHEVYEEWLDFQVFTRWYLNELKRLNGKVFRIKNYLEEDGVYRPPIVVEPYVQQCFISYGLIVKKEPTAINELRATGQEFGYPKCCIDSFIKDITDARIGRRQDRVFNGTGYIPCATCDVRYSEQELIDNININRHSKHLLFYKLYQ